MVTRPVKNRASTPPYVKDEAIEPFKGMVIDDAELAHWYNDFVNGRDFAAADWVITTIEAGAGDASEVIGAQELNGALVITNDNADADKDSLQQSNGSVAVLEMWKLVVGKRLAIKTKFKLSDVTDTGFVLGFCITDTTLVAGMSDGIYFRKADLDPILKAVSEKDSVEDTLDIATMVDDTFIEVGMAWDGKNNIEVFLLVLGAWTSIGKLTSTASHPDDEQLAISFELLNGSAVAHVLTIDYIEAKQER